MDASEILLSKALESLAGAESEYANGRYNNCANRCYYACFQSAIHALVRAGVTSGPEEWSHAFVQARFVGDLINRRKLYPASCGMLWPATLFCGRWQITGWRLSARSKPCGPFGEPASL